MRCEHSLILLKTSSGYVYFACLQCFKAEPIQPEKDFICECGNEGTECWTFSSKYNCIYCKDCNRIIKS